MPEPKRPITTTAKNAPRLSRRNFVKSTVAAGAITGTGLGLHGSVRAETVKPLRWGFVGTGGIANSMAQITKRAPSAQLVASSSRSIEKAQAFAGKHGADEAFDSWQEMAQWDGIDAIYVATPTSVREEICIAAANAGKHVLGEKPFASADSVRRIVDACRRADVAFMDGTHFAHHPRTIALHRDLDSLVGKRRTVDSVFQFPLSDASNIRMNPALEPMGAIGDAGWYNMRAIVEFMGNDLDLHDVSAFLRRDQATRAVVGASGVVGFTDGSVSTWNCGFDAGAVLTSLRIDGASGTIDIDDFLGQDRDGSASYRFRSGGWWVESVDRSERIESALPGAALMFEDYSKQAQHHQLRKQWRDATLRTQKLLDLVWADALRNE